MVLISLHFQTAFLLRETMAEIIMTTKTCSKCKVEKDVGEFNKNSRAKDGRQYRCRVCMAAYAKTDKRKAVRAVYQKTDKSKAAQAEYRRTDEGRFARSKGSAKTRGIEFLFTFEEYEALIAESERCYYCDRTEKECNDLSEFVRNYEGDDPKVLKLKINLGGFAHASTHFSIDRLNSFGPYSDENCVMSCSLCNETKGWAISGKSWKKIANDAIDEITNTCVDAGFDKES